MEDIQTSKFLKEIIEMNGIIAKFHCSTDAKDTLYYYSSWDSLMSVVEKINGLGKEYNLSIFKTYVAVSVEKGGKVYKDFSFAHSENITSTQTPKEATYKVVVKFIKWYNENSGK